MALVIKDRVRETSTTTGTGTYTLLGNEVGFRTFSSGIGNGNTCGYVVVMGSNWEAGIGTVAAGTLARTQVIASSNGNNAVSWAAGTKQAAHVAIAALLPMLQGDNVWTGNQLLQSTTGDISDEVRVDGDFTPRRSLRRTAGSSFSNRLWQDRIGPNGDFVVRDASLSLDRWSILTSGHIVPGTDTTQDMGTTSLRWGDLFMAGYLRLKASAGREVHIECVGDGSQPSLRLQKSGVTSDTARDWQVRINADGQMSIRDQTAGADRILIGLNGTFAPATDNNLSCGNASLRWQTIFATSGVVSTSDAREKTDILESDLGLELLQNLRPVSFRWKKDQGDTPPSYGIIAQDLEMALDGRPFAGLQYDKEVDRYGLNYAQLTPILIKAIQELASRVRALEHDLA